MEGKVMLSRLIVLLAAAVLATGCATSTAPGAVGVTRSQLLMVSSSLVNARAAEGYAKLSTEASQAGRLNRDAALTTRVRDIAARLIAHVGTFRPEATGWHWEVNVIENDALNAFCMPGGKIGVYTGLLRKLEMTDEEVAAVMGHEIAHALREHTREKVSQQTLTAAVAQAVANSNSRYATANAQLTQLGAQLFLHLPFSRDMELEADVMGLELMARAGYDPQAASQVWIKMQRHAGGGGVEFFRTHPNHERRVAAIEEAVPKVRSLYATAARPTARGTTPLVAPAVTAPPVIATVTSPPGNGGTTISPAGASAFSADSGSKSLGQDSFQVERMARGESCHASPQAKLTAKGPGFETYTVHCSNGDAWTYRCEFGNCRQLK